MRHFVSRAADQPPSAACRPIPLALALLALSACASTDPTVDIERSADSAATLIGRRPDFASDWSAPAPWSGSTPLSCDEALSLALGRNRDLRIAVAEIATARSELAAADTPPNPMLDVGIGLPLEAMGTSVTAAAMQQLAWLWQRPSRLDAGEARLRAAVLAAADRAVSVASRIQIEFASVVAAEELVRTRERATAATQSLLGAIDSAVTQGTVPEFERRDAADVAATAERDLAMSRERLVRARAALLESLALAELRSDWRTDGSWPTVSLADADPVDAARGRLDVAAAEAQLVAAQAELRTADTARFGGVGVGAMFERMSDGETMLGPAVSVEVPILDRGDPRIAAARAGLESARLKADAASQAAITQCRVAQAAANIADQRFREGSDLRRAIAAERMRQVGAMVEAGTAPAVELAKAELMLAEREADSVDDRLAAVTARIELARTLGVQPAPRHADPLDAKTVTQAPRWNGGRP